MFRCSFVVSEQKCHHFHAHPDLFSTIVFFGETISASCVSYIRKCPISLRLRLAYFDTYTRKYPRGFALSGTSISKSIKFFLIIAVYIHTNSNIFFTFFVASPYRKTFKYFTRFVLHSTSNNINKK